MYASSRRAFTLIELLVVIAIIAILAVVVVLTLNPAELLKQSRDSNRLSDLSTMSDALGLYSVDVGGSLGSSSITYLSVPDPNATSTAGDQCQALGLSSSSWQCAGSSTLRNIDATGWIPVNFKSISTGAPISELPIDPVNQTSSDLFYTYQTNGTQYELTAKMESQKYQSVAANDGGPYADLVEQGTNLTLAAMDFGGGSGGSATGTVSQANMKLSTINGIAFVDFGASGSLTSYIGDKLTITDSGGHQIVGYIKTAGTGETYGTQLLSNTDFATTTSLFSTGALSSVSGGQSGNALQVANVGGGWNYWGESFTGSVGDLLLSSIYMKIGNGGNPQTFYVGINGGSNYNSTPAVTPSGWTNYPLYSTAGVTSLEIGGQQQFYGGDTALYDTASVQQVLTPSATGVTITSVAGGSTYNWASMDSGFNLDDSGGYTTSIATGANPNVYSISLASDPGVVIFNGALGQRKSSVSALTNNNDYYYDGVGHLYILESSTPSGMTIEGGLRSYGITTNGQNYLTIQNLNLSGTIDWGAGIYVDGSRYISVNNCNLSNNYYAGFLAEGNHGYITLSGNTISGNGSNGAIFYDDSGNTDMGYNLVTLNTVSNNGWRNVEGFGISGPFSNSTISYNTVYNNGFGGVSWPVYNHGIYVTGGNGVNTVVENNTTYGQPYGSGIKLTDSGTVKNNISYNNGRAGIQIGTNGAYNITANVNYNICYGNGYGIAELDLGSGNASGTISLNIFNNTLYNNTDTVEVTGGNTREIMIGDSNLASLVVKNNILSGAAQENVALEPQSNMIWDYNIINPATIWEDPTVFSWAQWQGLGNDTHGVNADPLFISTSTNNFALSSSSPAIDAGVNLGTSYDMGLDPASTWPSNVLTLNQNNYGSGWDIGAYVYTQTSTPSIAWISPANSGSVSSTITLSASSTAVAPASITSIQFYLDGSPLGSPVTSTSSPNTYSYSWNTDTVSNGTHTLYALATDNYGNTASSSALSFAVSNAPAPVVEVGAGYAPPPVIPPPPIASATTTSQASSTITIPTSTTLSASVSTSSLQAEIDALFVELKALEVQAGITSSPSSSPYSFTTNLELYDTGSAVNALQNYLVQQDKGTAVERLKAHGTTSFFGIMTFNALVGFQKSVGITPASGYFGPITRAYVNGHE